MPFRRSIFGVDSQERALENTPFPSFLHPVTETKPLIMGACPVPKAPITIGDPDVPDFVGVRVPPKISPLLNSILSPGFNR